MRTTRNSIPPPVLFLAAPRWYAAHSAARSLARYGARVFMLEHRGISPSNLSRFCAGTFRAGDDGRPLGEPDRISSDLVAAGRALGRGTILIAGTDEWAEFVAQHDAELRTTFEFPRQAPGLVAALASKEGLCQIASRHGIPTPRLVVPRTMEEALVTAENLLYPVMVKPAVSRPNVEMKALAGSPEELTGYARALAESDETPNLVFQEYIPGRDEDVWMFTGYFDSDSRCLVAFTGQKLRQQPPHMGHTSLGVLRTNPELMQMASRFMTDMGYRGIVDSGYRYDARDGGYKVLDINPRVGGNFRQFLGVGGIDVVRALYLDLCGKPVPPTTPREGRLWLKEDSDLVASFRYWRAGELGLRAWMRSIRAVDEGATFSVRDPMPFLAAMLMLVLDTVKGRWDKRRRSREGGEATRAMEAARTTRGVLLR
jgi:D-aspartate ligase